jgi:hypothetical protein
MKLWVQQKNEMFNFCKSQNKKKPIVAKNLKSKNVWCMKLWCCNQLKTKCKDMEQSAKRKLSWVLPKP